MYGSVVRPTILGINLVVYFFSSLLPVYNVWLSGTSYYTKYRPSSLFVLVLYCLCTMYGLAVRPTILSTDLVVYLL